MGARGVVAAGLGCRWQSDTEQTGTRTVAADGRYCVLIEWKSIGAEAWCRYIIQSAEAYYATKSDKTGTEKIYKLTISKP